MKKQTKLWTTRDGHRVRVCDMSDTHLLNSIRLLQRWAEAKRITTVDFYVNTLGPQGDAAQMCFDQEFHAVLDSTYEDYLPDIYENLKLEAERRELEIPEQPSRIDLEIELVAKHAEQRGRHT